MDVDSQRRSLIACARAEHEDALSGVASVRQPLGPFGTRRPVALSASAILTALLQPLAKSIAWSRIGQARCKKSSRKCDKDRSSPHSLRMVRPRQSGWLADQLATELHGFAAIVGCVIGLKLIHAVSPFHSIGFERCPDEKKSVERSEPVSSTFEFWRSLFEK
jgi:hypothetical protein